MTSPIASYKKTMAQTASPLENVIALHEKCLVQLNRLRHSIQDGQVSTKAESLHKAVEIITVLDGELDLNQEEIALPLHLLYQAMLAQLTEANLKSTVVNVDHTITWLTELLETWREIQRETKSGGKK